MREILLKASSSSLFCWHESFSLLPYVQINYRKDKPIMGLVSLSKNGGRSAINLIRCLRSGGDICITPDGPRGPCRNAKVGMFTICQKSPESRLVFINIKIDSYWEFKSWDKFKIPKPFSKVFMEVYESENLQSFDDDAAKRGFTRLEFCELLLS